MEQRTSVAPAVPARRVWLAVLLAMVVVYAVTLENGLVLADGARHLHELFHDGRHLLGVPCH